MDRTLICVKCVRAHRRREGASWPRAASIERDDDQSSRATGIEQSDAHASEGPRSRISSHYPMRLECSSKSRTVWASEAMPICKATQFSIVVLCCRRRESVTAMPRACSSNSRACRQGRPADQRTPANGASAVWCALKADQPIARRQALARTSIVSASRLKACGSMSRRRYAGISLPTMIAGPRSSDASGVACADPECTVFLLTHTLFLKLKPASALTLQGSIGEPASPKLPRPP